MNKTAVTPTNGHGKTAIILSAVFMLYTVLAFFNSSGVVLCVGQNGHVAIEVAGVSAHSDLQDLKSNVRLYDSEHQVHGSHCRDASLSQNLNAVLLPVKSKLLPATTSLFITFPGWIPERVQGKAITFEIPDPSTSQLHQIVRSTVLLI